MRRGKDDEKILEPMFPRLHVKDSDKRGPRAPPRNKMALYEQLSIPSQRFNNHLTTTSLIPPQQSTQACGGETLLYVQQKVSSSSRVHAADKFVTQGSCMENLSSLARYDQRKMVGEEDDFSVPVFVNSRTVVSHGRNKNGTDKENPTSSVAPSSHHSSKILEVNPESTKQNASFPALVREQVKENTKQVALLNSVYLSAREETNVDKSKSDYYGENSRDASLRRESRNRFDGDGETCGKDTDNGVESQLQRENSSGRAHGSPDEVDNGGGYEKSGEHDSQQQRNEEASDGVSESSMVDSISSTNVSPDDIVGIIGQKCFWRARKAINTQQRVFAVQLFELHRLIKVQRLIAASPDLLLDDVTYLERASAKSSPIKKLLPSEYIVKPLPRVAKHRDDSEKTNKMECSAENVFGRSHVSPSNGPHMTPTGDNGWCFPPQPTPGNHQWLIPVMSPSEGLIFKPYPGPAGPAGGGYYGHFNYMGGGPTPAYHPGVGFPSYFPASYPMPNYSWQQSPSEQMMNHSQQQSSCNFPPNSTTANEAAAAALQPPKKPQLRTRESSNNGNEPQPTAVATRVIRVVPHNARLASENAARIFQAIQEERKHYEHF